MMMRPFDLPAAPDVRRALCAFALLASGLVAACGEESTTTPPVDVPLTQGDWYMHRANDLEMPAEVARRFVGVVDEQTVVDSSRISVNGDGTWEQRFETRVLHNGVLDRTEVVHDEGTWSAVGSITTFTSTVRPRSFTMTALAADQAASNEPMVFFANATNVAGVYRTTPPTP